MLADGNNGFYYQTFDSAITQDGDVMRVLDVRAKQVGIRGIFSDWAATVTYYASCMGLNGVERRATGLATDCHRGSRETTMTTRVTAARRPPVPVKIALTW